MIAIGIDTGGTCTDSVVYRTETKEILAFAKSPTTHGALEVGIGRSLRKLPAHLRRQAKYVSLSTTLATNACVENKGDKVCLIFIGTPRTTLEETYRSFGFDSMEFMRFLKGDPSQNEEPDWDAFDAMLPEILENYGSVAISQLFPGMNDGAFEKEARRRIRERKNITVVCGYEIFKERNTIRRGAGALLNARLIPIIEDFFRAVNKVLAEEKMDIPLVIMRSDGSLVSEKYSSLYPVETLLCGPTASVKGGMELMNEKNAVIIDIGGTTSDIALVKNSEPQLDKDGVTVGQWKTLVQGIAVDTFALGGDTRVCYRDRDLYLGSRRVIPIANLAAAHPEVITELKDLAEKKGESSVPLYEHLVLMQDNPKRAHLYTERENGTIKLLRSGPMSLRQIADRLGIDPYALDTNRLEDEGVLMRSGITPTDAMIIKGDFVSDGSEASAYAMCFLEKCITDPIKKQYARHTCPMRQNSMETPEISLQQSERFGDILRKAQGVADQIYYLVKEKLYCNLVRILWKDSHKSVKTVSGELEHFAKEAFSDFMKENGPDDVSFYKGFFHTEASLVGVGAPTHVFLPDVAKAFGTRCCLSDYSGVCNALGAMLGDVCTYETVPIEIRNVIGGFDVEEEIFVVYAIGPEKYDKKEDAVARAEEIAKARAVEKAKLCGAREIYDVSVTNKDRNGDSRLGAIYLGTDVTVRMKGRLI